MDKFTFATNELLKANIGQEITLDLGGGCKLTGKLRKAPHDQNYQQIHFGLDEHFGAWFNASMIQAIFWHGGGDGISEIKI